MFFMLGSSSLQPLKIATTAQNNLCHYTANNYTQTQLLPLVTYPSSFFLQLLIMPGRHCLVAVDRDAPIGFVSAMVYDTPDAAYRSEREEVDYLVDSYLRLASKSTIQPRKGRSGLVSSFGESSPREPRLELLTLGVVPQYQNSGLGRRLVQDLVGRVRESLPKSSGRFA